MAKQRIINTRLWSDSFIQELKTHEKLLFIYILTNEHTNLCGIYECSMRTIEFETGINKKDLKQAIYTLQQAGKVVFFDGWVHIKNFSKYQNENPSIKKGIENAKAEIPAYILDKIQAGHKVGTDCIRPATTLTLTKPELEPESKPELIKEKVFGKREGTNLFLDCIWLTEKEHENLAVKYGEEMRDETMDNMKIWAFSDKKSQKKFRDKLDHNLTLQQWMNRELEEKQSKIEGHINKAKAQKFVAETTPRKKLEILKSVR